MNPMGFCYLDTSRDETTLVKHIFTFVSVKYAIGKKHNCIFCSRFIDATRKCKRLSLPRVSVVVHRTALRDLSNDASWDTSFQGPGLIFCHSEDRYAFDSKQIGGPVVLKEVEENEETIWKMWYYGRSIGFPSKSNLVDLPTGCIGYATSKDGIHWNRISGLEEQGSVLAPSRNNEADFDSAHIGVSDVVVCFVLLLSLSSKLKIDRNARLKVTLVAIASIISTILVEVMPYPLSR